MWGKLETVLFWMLGKLYHMAGKELTNRTFQSLMQFVRFGIVGVSNTVISYVLYAGGLLGFRAWGIFVHSDYVVAQLLAFVLSVLWSFYWNNKFVFTLQNGQIRSVWKALAKTYISYSFTGLFLNSILLIFFVQVLHISEFIAPAINLCISVPINFMINKFWAFKTCEKRAGN